MTNKTAIEALEDLVGDSCRGGDIDDISANEKIITDALAREAALREELNRHRLLYIQLEKALSRVHCMYGKRLLDLTGERQTVLVPDEEFVKYFEELKCLKGENSAIQQRLTVAGELLKRFDTMFSGGICSGPLQDLAADVRAALKTATEAEIARDQGIPGTSFQRLNQLANEGE